ncbi:MAG: GNAT family N-acetyltransferase [Actinomycetota bacterium]
MIRGEKVALRPLSREDLPVLGEMLAKPGVAHYWPNYDAARLEKDVFGPDSDDLTAFVVEFEGRTAGLIWYYEEKEPEYRYAGIDMFIDCDFQSMGLGSDSLRAIARHLFEERKHHRIVIDPRVSNDRAVHVYKKVGFKPVGVMRRYEDLLDGRYEDGLLMDMLPEDLA